MGCIIKIKGKEHFKEFASEEEARKWVEENRKNISIEEFTNPYTKKKELYIATKDAQESTVTAIRAANARSYEFIGDTLTKTRLDDFNTEEYDKFSDALSLSKALASLRIVDAEGNYKRLFPEFITANWLNVVAQRLIIQRLRELNGDEINDVIIETERTKYFNEDTIPSSWIEDGKVHKASEWYSLVKTQYNSELDSDILANIDDEVKTTNQNAMKMMLLGEIQHKIFELIIHHPKESEAEIKARTAAIFDDFNKKYNHTKFTEVEDPEAVIAIIQASFDSIYSSYYNMAKNAKMNIERTFRASNPGANISWLSEQKITCDLDDPISSKTKIRGKIDAIIVVNGVPHIIDFKVSKKTFVEWDNAKTLKVDYTLAMYQRMLSKLGLPTSSTTIHVYNITLDSNNKAVTGELVSRTADIKNNTKLNRNLDEIFKAAATVKDLNPKIFDDVNTAISKLFGKTSRKGRRDISVDSMVEILKDRLTPVGGKWFLRYHIFDRDTTTMKSMTMKADSKKEALEKIKVIANEIIKLNEEAFSIRYDTLIDDINEFLTTGKEINSFTSVHGDTKLANFYGALLYKYQGSDAKIINSPLAKANGLILIKTDTGIDMISVSPYDPFSDYDQTQKGHPLFDSGNSDLKRSIGNVNIVQALLVANEILRESTDSIDNVIAIQLGEPVGHRVRVLDLKYMIESACSICGITNNLNSKFTDPLTNVLNAWTRYFYWVNNIPTKKGKTLNYTKIENLESLDKSKKDILLDILRSNDRLKINDFTGFEKLNVSQNIEILKSLRDILMQEYYTIFNNTSDVSISPETVLMAEIEKAIQVYTGNEVSDTFSLKRYSLAGSTLLNSMDTIPDENVAIIRDAINRSMSTVTNRFNTFNSKQRAIIEKLKESKGYSKLRQLTVGDMVKLYRNLYRPQNEANPDLILKDPWTDTSLNEVEKEYIKFVLFHLNKRKYKWTKLSELDPNKLQDVDYNVPLVRADGIQKLSNNGVVSALKFRSWVEELRNKLVSSGDIFEEQQLDRKKEIEKFERFYNQFSVRRNKEIRKDTIERLGIDQFSLDLETIMDQYIIADESQEEFDNNTIPLIRSVLYVSEFNTHLTGRDQSVFNEFIMKTTKSVIYNSSIMDEEVQGFMKKFAPLRAAAFAIGLGFNVMNVPRELIMGFFQNIKSAALKSYGKESFTMKDYMKAFGILSGDVPGFITNVTKIELLNEFYRMSNMTITEIPQQVTTNKTGVFAMFNRFMSWSLTAPDYFNRMSIFVAQMLHDGTWEAHDMVTNPDGSKELRYDITKDKRFDVFIKYKGDYSRVPDAEREKFNYQEALYNVMLEEMNKGSNTPFVYKKGTVPWLPQAYTERERASIKSFADTSFGYYDNDVKAMFFKTAIGQIFKQFMAYMAGKKVQYYQAGSNKTARGGFAQLTDVKGDKIWRVLDKEGNPVVKTDSELTPEERRDAKPVLAWKGTYIEGIVQSYWNLIKDLGVNLRNTFSNENPTQWRKLFKEYFGDRNNIRTRNIYQLWSDLALSTLIIMLFRLLFFDDPEVCGMSYKKQLSQSAPITQNLYSIVTNATNDFDVLNLMRNGIFTWEPPTLGILENAAKTFWKTAGDDDLNIFEATAVSAAKTFGVLRPVRPLANWYVEQEHENN